MNERWQLVLADFGTCKVLNDLEPDQPRALKKSSSTNQLPVDLPNLLDDDNEKDLVGTEDYISPEALENIASSEVTFSTDLWSLGVIIWQIFAKDNTTPFSADSQALTF